MSLPYHAWTHSKDGTDPIEVVTGGPISALAIAGNRSQALNGTLNLMYDLLYTNDGSFGFSDVTSSRARFVTMTTGGWYRGKFIVSWMQSDADFSASDLPEIRPMCDFEGSPDVLVNAVDIAWNDTSGPPYTLQLSSDDVLHWALTCTVDFNFDPDFFEITTFGIGCRIDSVGSSVTKNFGGMLSLTRLGDILTEVTIT